MPSALAEERLLLTPAYQMKVREARRAGYHPLTKVKTSLSRVEKAA